MSTATLTHEFDGGDEFDIEPAVFKIEYLADERPPEALETAVHDALRRTILHALDGRRGFWKIEDANWLFGLYSLPELPATGDDGGHLGWKPAYMTEEKIEGADGSGDGLLGNLPEGWSFEAARSGVWAFYEE